MPADPAVIAEATGKQSVAVDVGGRTFTVPADVDTWPLELIRSGGASLYHAVQLLLGEQWPQFNATSSKRRDLREFTNAAATAVGFPPRTADEKVFGALPWMLSLIDQHEAQVESDLSRFWGLDYRDRWRFDTAGHRRLTLRMIYVRISNLPPTAAVAVALNGGKTIPTRVELLVMDVFEAMTGRAHPARPMSAEEQKKRNADAERREKARAQTQARAAAHRTSTGNQQSLIDKAKANARQAQGRDLDAYRQEDRHQDHHDQRTGRTAGWRHHDR